MRGWISYRVSDKSGIGYNDTKFIYAPGWESSDPQEIEGMIISYYESWAMHDPECLRFKLVEIGCTPPIEMIEKEMKEIDERLASLSGSKKQLELQLAFAKAITTE